MLHCCCWAVLQAGMAKQNACQRMMQLPSVPDSCVLGAAMKQVRCAQWKRWPGSRCMLGRYHQRCVLCTAGSQHGLGQGRLSY